MMFKHLKLAVVLAVAVSALVAIPAYAAFFGITRTLPATVEIVEPPTVTLDLELKAGWNLVSLPVYPGTTDPDIILKDAGWYSIYAWDAAGKRYVKPGAEGMVVGKGYWVMVLNDVTQSITGFQIREFVFKAPSPGWYLIGSLDCQAAFVADPSGNAYTEVYEWDAINKKYTEPLATITPGTGNWFLAIAPCGVIVRPCAAE